MVEVSLEHGVGNVTVTHAVERSGVSRRTFYEIFEDREECFLAALDDALARARAYVLDGYDPAAAWVERIRMCLIGLLDFLDAERGAGWLLIVGSLGVGAGARAQERRRNVLDQVAAVVDEGRGVSGGEGLPSLTGEGVVGGVLSVLHSRLVDGHGSLLELTGPLMGMIVSPYLGVAAARREFERSVPVRAHRDEPKPGLANHLRDVQMRLTYRTLRVLIAVAAKPGSSNREIGLAAGVGDQGQISRLLTRLDRLGLIENSDAGRTPGARNAWVLTAKGQEVEQAIAHE